MQQETIPILQAIKGESLLVSVHRNHLYNAAASVKSNYKLVLVITAQQEEGLRLKKHILKSVPKLDYLLESSTDNGILYMLVYCKDVPTVSHITSKPFKKHILRSNKDYEETDRSTLMRKAEALEPIEK